MQPIQDTSSEEWRPVVGYEGRYDVSSLGRVWSHCSARTLSGWGKGSYLKVQLDGKTWFVHQLVAFAFIGPRPDGQVVRHLDDDHMRNRADNLAYGTQAQNCADTIRNGHSAQKNRTHCPKGHAYDDTNTRWRKDRPGNRGCRTCEVESARKTGAASPHGSLSKYKGGDCRCDLCREANRIYMRDRREAKKTVTRLASERIPA
jgi:hypothetical protein